MRKTAATLFLFCVVVYHVNGRPRPEIDCVAAPYTAWALVRYQSLDLRFFPELRRYIGVHIRETSDGLWISIRPPGSALAVVPFVAPFALLREQPLRSRDMHHVGKLAAAVAVAGAAVFFFMICRTFAPAAAWPATILFAFGTCLWSVASQAIGIHGPATFWLCCGLYFLSRGDLRSAGWWVAAGLALGLAVFTRTTTVFFVLATAGALLVQKKWSANLWFVVGAAGPVGLALLFNRVYFADWVFGGYASDNWAGATPLSIGLPGLLIAPSRGLLVYSPALLLAVPGIIRLVRSTDARSADLRIMVVAWLLASGVSLLFFAHWHHWWGGWSYGPRLLTETLPVWCLAFAIGYSGLMKRWQRDLANGLVGLSVAVHFVGVFGYSGYEAWQRRHDLPDQGRSMFQFHDTQIEAHARAFLRKLRILEPNDVDKVKRQNGG